MCKTENKKSLFKTLLLFLLIYAGLMTLFIGFNTVVAALPHTDRMEENFRKSAFILKNEGSLYRHLWVATDTCADSMILNIALGYRYNHTNPLTAAMQNSMRCTIPTSSNEIELSLFADSPAAVAKSDKFQTINYNRYFFGSSPFIKLFHYFAALKSFQVLLGSAVAVLAFILFAKLYKNSDKIKLAAWLFLLFT